MPNHWQTVIPSGEAVGIRKRLFNNDQMFTTLTGQRPFFFAVGVKYSDVGDNQRTQSVIYFSMVDDEGLKTDRVELYHCDGNWIREADPFVSSLVPST